MGRMTRPAVQFAAERYARQSGWAGLRAAEIGVYRGDHAEEILAALTPEFLLLADPWCPDADWIAFARSRFPAEKIERFLATDWDGMYLDVCARFAGRPEIALWRLPSVRAASLMADGSAFHFVYIDGNHSEQAVYADLEAWAPRILPGGVLAGHDHYDGQTGVLRAVARWAEKTGLKAQTAEKDFWFVMPEDFKHDKARERFEDPDSRWDDLRRRILWTLEHLGSDPVVDLGSGAGPLPILAATRGRYVTAVDRSYEALADMRRFKPSAGLIDLRHALAERTGLPDASAGTVVLGEVLEHVEYAPALVAEAVRLLRPGGTVIVTVPEGGRRSREHKRTFADAAAVRRLWPDDWQWTDETRIGPWLALAARKPEKEAS